jgi:hypothetical protein
MQGSGGNPAKGNDFFIFRNWLDFSLWRWSMAGKTTIGLFLVMLFAIGSMTVGCGASEKAMQAAIAKTQAAAPTITFTPTQKPAPTHTSTPAPVAVPLMYPGWTDHAFTRVCVDGQTVFMAEEPIPGVTDVDVAARIIPAASALLEAMGMKVVPVEGDCEALYAFFITMGAVMKTEYHANGDSCSTYSEADLMGDFVFMAPPGGDGFNFHLSTKYKVPEETWICNEIKEPPYDSVWPRTVVEAFYKVYGETALQAATTVPELQPYAEDLLK